MSEFAGDFHFMSASSWCLKCSYNIDVMMYQEAEFLLHTGLGKAVLSSYTSLGETNNISCSRGHFFLKLNSRGGGKQSCSLNLSFLFGIQ